MQENDFEKQVRHQLEQLHLKPNSEVWMKVQQEIRPRKKRRALIWLPLAAMLAGAGAWLLLGPAQVNPTPPIAAETVGKEKGHTSGSTPENNSVKSEKNTSDRTAQAIDKNSQKETASIGDNTPVTPLKPSISTPHSTLPLQQHPQKKSSHTGAAKKSGLMDGNPTAAKGNRLELREEEGQTEMGSLKEKAGESEADQGKLVHGNNSFVGMDANTKKETLSSVEVASLTPSVVTSIKIPVEGFEVHNIPAETKAAMDIDLGKMANFSSNRNRWIYGVNISGGAAWPVHSASQEADPSLSFASALPLPAPPFMRPSFAPPVMPVGVRPAAEPGAGFSFKAGVYGGRDWKNRFRLTAGVQYAQMNIQYRVGEYVDQLTQVSINGGNLQVGSYYQNGVDRAYTSHFHFLEIPVEGSYTFNPTSRLPISLNAGGTVGYLLKTDGLHYSKTSGIYYKDITHYNRTQFSLQGGLSMKFLQWGKQSFSAGPVFQYSLTSNRNKSLFRQEHLSFLGLRLGVGLR